MKWRNYSTCRANLIRLISYRFHWWKMSLNLNFTRREQLLVKWSSLRNWVADCRRSFIKIVCMRFRRRRRRWCEGEMEEERNRAALAKDAPHAKHVLQLRRHRERNFFAMLFTFFFGHIETLWLRCWIDFTRNYFRSKLLFNYTSLHSGYDIGKEQCGSNGRRSLISSLLGI